MVGAKKTSFEKEIYSAKAAKAKAEKAMERAQQELAANVAVIERLKQENAEMRVSLAEAARDHASAHQAPPSKGLRRRSERATYRCCECDSYALEPHGWQMTCRTRSSRCRHTGKS